MFAFRTSDGRVASFEENEDDIYRGAKLRGGRSAEKAFERGVDRRRVMQRTGAEQAFEDLLFHLVDIAEQEDDLRVFHP